MKHISAGLVVIYRNQILLVRQSDDVTGHHLSIPKGLVKPDENPLMAAIRETYEETGIIIPLHTVKSQPYLMNIETVHCKRRIIYYIAHIDEMPLPEPVDTAEISWAGFLDYDHAEKKLQYTQLSVLLHLDPCRLPVRATRWLCMNGYLSKEEHYEDDLYIYNYTSRCKTDSLWDEITLWCRGLITDRNNKILYRPLKKFFEESQIYEYFIPDKKTGYSLFEKKDGALGILYWSDGLPYIATRGSFNTAQAVNGTIMLYSKYIDDIPKLDRTYTYFFEIIYPEDRHVVDYGEVSDLFLIGAYDNIARRDIMPSEITGLAFPKVKQYDVTENWQELYKLNKENEEGYVAYFDDGTRIKIKFENYKIKHEKLYI